MILPVFTTTQPILVYKIFFQAPRGRSTCGDCFIGGCHEFREDQIFMQLDEIPADFGKRGVLVEPWWNGELHGWQKGSELGPSDIELSVWINAL